MCNTDISGNGKMILLWICVFGFTLKDVFCCQWKPQQIHLSLGDSHDSMVVMWSTNGPVKAFVEYGEDTDFRSVSEVSGMTELQTDSWNALRYIHRAVLTNLKSGTRYYYAVTCTSDTEKRTSKIFSFRTLPTDKNVATRYLVYGDMGAVGGKPTFPILEEEVATGKYDVIWHIGDFAYDMNDDGGSVGDLFMREIENIAGNIPYMTSPGNHELSNDQEHYRKRFSMPVGEWPMPLDKLWYSYNIGHVHFISYSSEVYFTFDQFYVCQQFEWLRNDLLEANKNRHAQPWIVAMAHRPFYCSDSDFDDCTGKLTSRWVKYGLENLFHAQGVDLVLEAHEHSYERLWPVYGEKVTAMHYNNPRGSVHVVTGAAGSKEKWDSIKTNGGMWSAFRAGKEASHSYGRLFVPNATHLFFEQVEVSDSSVLDSFWLVQDSHGPFVVNATCTGDEDSWHLSCHCPPIIHYVELIAWIVTGFVAVIAIAIAGCCYCWRKIKRCRKVNKGHALLINQADSDDSGDQDEDNFAI